MDGAEEPLCAGGNGHRSEKCSGPKGGTQLHGVGLRAETQWSRWEAHRGACHQVWGLPGCETGNM